MRTVVVGIKRFAAKNTLCLVMLQKLWEWLRRAVYCLFFRFHRIDPTLIVFESYYGKAYACNPKALYEELQRSEQGKRYRFIWAFQNVTDRDTLPDGLRTTLVEHDSAAYKRAMASARYYIANSLAPNYICFKKGQTYVQTWHGTPLKRLGCDIEVDCNSVNTTHEIHRRYINRAARFDYMLSPSRFCTEKLISAFGLDRLHKQNIVIETGYPRNDFLFRYTASDVAAIKERLHIPADKYLLLYAPTFRDNQTSGGVFTYTCPLDFNALVDALGSDWVILFRAHYLIADRFDFSAYDGRLINVSAVDDVNELYVISDALLTDYSSVFFDYANLCRPILFYMYDLAEYRDSVRNFYIDLTELPGPLFETEEALLGQIASYIRSFTCGESYEAFRRKFNYLDDANAAQRVLSVILPDKTAKENSCD